MLDAGVFVVKTWRKGGVSHSGQSIVGIEKTKRIRGIGRKKWEGSWISEAA